MNAERDPGELSEEDLRFAQSKVPILCVDVLGRGSDGRYLLIRRLDRGGREGWNLVGGRMRKDESPAEAVGRHIAETLGDAVDWDEPVWERPHRVAFFEHAETGDGPYDPAQRAVSLTYVVDLRGDPVAQGEATGFEWFSPEGLPEDDAFGFNQGQVVRPLV